MLTLADLKAHLEIESDDENAFLTAKLGAAQGACARFIGRDDLDADEAAARDEAVLRLAASFYDNRSGRDEMPAGVVDLLRPLRAWTF